MSFSDFKDVHHKACLMLMINEPGSPQMQMLPIPPGANLWLTEELGNESVTFPTVLSKVSRKLIEFKCACAIPGCTRRVQYKVQVHGVHAQKDGKRKVAPPSHRG